MEIIKLEKNKGFEFKLEPLFLDERRIQQEMAYTLGGWEKLGELDSAILTNYKKHLEHNKEKHGDEFDKKYARLVELESKGEETEEYKQLREELTNNRYYRAYIGLLQEKTLLYNYSMLIVLCIRKPDGFDFHEQKEEKLIELFNEYSELKKKQTSGSTA